MQGCLYFTTLVVAAISDARTRTIPNWLVVCSIAGWLGIVLLEGNAGRAATGLVSGASISVVPLVIGLVGKRIRGTDIIGAGDIKLLFAMGLYLPLEAALLGLLLSCVCGLCLGFAMRKQGRFHPFGVAIAIGFSVVALM